MPALCPRIDTDIDQKVGRTQQDSKGKKSNLKHTGLNALFVLCQLALAFAPNGRKDEIRNGLLTTTGSMVSRANHLFYERKDLLTH